MHGLAEQGYQTQPVRQNALVYHRDLRFWPRSAGPCLLILEPVTSAVRRDSMARSTFSTGRFIASSA